MSDLQLQEWKTLGTDARKTPVRHYELKKERYMAQLSEALSQIQIKILRRCFIDEQDIF